MNGIPLTLETVATRITILEQSAHENSENHGKIYARIEAVEKGQAVINGSLSNIEKVCAAISADVKSLKEKPAKRYETIVVSAIQGVITLIIGGIAILGR